MRPRLESRLSPGVTGRRIHRAERTEVLKPYEVESMTIDSNAATITNVLDASPALSLAAFMERVATHLNSTISIYTLSDDHFVRILTTDQQTDEAGRFEIVPRDECPIMDELVRKDPDMYVADFSSAQNRRGGDSYVGFHLIPKLHRRRIDDPDEDDHHIVLNVQTQQGHVLTQSDLTLLRLLKPMISKDIQWTQLIALKDRDEQGYLRDPDQFYEIVQDRCRRTAETGKRYGIICTDLRSYGIFNKIAGQSMGNRVLEQKRLAMRAVMRAGDIPALKGYVFKVRDGKSVEILKSDVTAARGGDESTFAASTRSLSDLVIMAHRLGDAVADIDVYALFCEEASRNPEFDADERYQRLCAAAPHMLQDGVFRLRLNAGVALLQPPTEDELTDPEKLAEYSRRAAWRADDAMQRAKDIDKAGDGHVIGYCMLQPDAHHNRSVYHPGFIGVDKIREKRRIYNLILDEPDPVQQAEMRERADGALYIELSENLVPERRDSLSETGRIPLTAYRSREAPINE